MSKSFKFSYTEAKKRNTTQRGSLAESVLSNKKHAQNNQPRVVETYSSENKLMKTS